MIRRRVDPLFWLGVVLTLWLLVLAWGRVPAEERLALLPLSASSLLLGGLLAWLGRLEVEQRPVADAAAQALVLQAAVAAAAFAFAWSLPRALCVGTGLALVVMGNATSRARPNLWFGFRTRWALLSERAWYATQRQAAPALVSTGAVFTVFAVLTPAALLIPWVLPLGLLALLVPVVFSLYRASYHAYRADPERRPAVPGARRHLPPLTSVERLLLALMLGLPLLSLTACAVALPRLPERVPVHFGLAGQPDRYGSPLELLALPLVGLGLAGFFAAMMRFGSATPAQRHLLLLTGALAGALTAPLPLGVSGDMSLPLGLGHVLMLAVLALALLFPGPDGKRRPRLAAGLATLAALLLLALFLLSGKAAQAAGMLFLVFGGLLFLLPLLLYSAPLNTPGRSKRGGSE